MTHVSLVFCGAATPQDDAPTDVSDLRRALVHHPVHRWASAPVDRTVLMVHQAICRWASAALAREWRIAGPERHFHQTRQSLRRRGAGRGVDAFVDAVNGGVHPATALTQAGGPSAAQPLVEAVWTVLASGNEAAQLGALAVGMPCCILDAVPALDRLDQLIRSDPQAAADAETAARAVLAGQAVLLDGALEAIRHRHMALHPSAWRPDRPALDRPLVLLP
jgi:hypothetical protein